MPKNNLMISEHLDAVAFPPISPDFSSSDQRNRITCVCRKDGGGVQSGPTIGSFVNSTATRQGSSSLLNWSQEFGDGASGSELVLVATVSEESSIMGKQHSDGPGCHITTGKRTNWV